MAGKSQKPGNAYNMPKPKKRSPKPKATANKRMMAYMKKRLSKPAKWS